MFSTSSKVARSLEESLVIFWEFDRVRGCFFPVVGPDLKLLDGFLNSEGRELIYIQLDGRAFGAGGLTRTDCLWIPSEALSLLG